MIELAEIKSDQDGAMTVLRTLEHQLSWACSACRLTGRDGTTVEIACL
jgi:hypothetical protein